jgi:hypothetical protein
MQNMNCHGKSSAECYFPVEHSGAEGVSGPEASVSKGIDCNLTRQSGIPQENSLPKIIAGAIGEPRCSDRPSRAWVAPASAISNAWGTSGSPERLSIFASKSARCCQGGVIRILRFWPFLARVMSSSAGRTSQDLCPVRSMQSEQVARNRFITGRNQDGQLVRNLANEIKINRNVILSFPEHEARVLEAPLNIGNDEVRPRRCFRSSHVNLHWNRQVVRLAE